MPFVLCCILCCRRSHLVQIFFQLALPVHSRYGKSITADLSRLWKLFVDCAITDNKRKIICIIDALDECEEDSRSQLISHLLAFLDEQSTVANSLDRSTVPTTKLKFIITSRPYDDIEYEFAAFPSVNFVRFHGDDKASDICEEIDIEEIDIVIDDLVSDVARSFSDNDKKRLADRLKQMNNRTHLWLYLTFDVIRKRPHKFGRPYDIDALLDMLPGQVANVALALVVAQQNEARHPFPRDASEVQSLLWPEGSFASTVTNLCGLLLTVSDGYLMFIHQTAIDFLVRPVSPGDKKKRSWQGRFTKQKSQELMASVCIRYLILPGLDVPTVSADRTPQVQHAHSQLVCHASFVWSYCFGSIVDQDAAKQWLYQAYILCNKNDTRSAVWRQTVDAMSTHDRLDLEDHKPMLADMSPLATASSFHLSAIVEYLLYTVEADVDKLDAEGRTAIIYSTI